MNKQTEEVSYEDIPKPLREAIAARIESDKRINALRDELFAAQRSMSFVRASQAEKKLKSVINGITTECLQKYENEALAIDKIIAQLPKEASEKATYLFTSLFMSADIIESAVMDLESILKTLNKEYEIQTMRPLRTTLKEARASLHLFSKQFSFLDYPFWGEAVDKMYEMLFNKAGVITRRAVKEEAKKKNNTNADTTK